jgi:hypothetical protein
MPIPKDKRDYAHETKLEKARPGAHDARMERQRARRKLDAEGVDRKGKHVSHVKALSKGGSNKEGVFLQSPKKNISYARGADHKPKATYDRKK